MFQEEKSEALNALYAFEKLGAMTFAVEVRRLLGEIEELVGSDWVTESERRRRRSPRFLRMCPSASHRRLSSLHPVSREVSEYRYHCHTSLSFSPQLVPDSSFPHSSLICTSCYVFLFHVSYLFYVYTSLRFSVTLHVLVWSSQDS
jgi:hypothetical protein